MTDEFDRKQDQEGERVKSSGKFKRLANLTLASSSHEISEHLSKASGKSWPAFTGSVADIL